MSNYNSAAKKILHNTIKRAILIDDEAVLPFEQNSEANSLCKDIYSSFKNNNALIDFIAYKTDSFDVQENVLKSKNDLIVLDWELTKAIPKYGKTLEIVREIVENQNPHFLCIYSHVPSSEFQDIILKIKAYLNNHRESHTAIDSLSVDLDTLGVDSESFIETFKLRYKDLLLSSNSDIDEKGRKLKDDVKSFINNSEIFKSFQQLENDINIKYLINGYIKNESNSKVLNTNVYRENNCLVVNNTIILIHQKGELNANQFIEGFSESILKIPHSFLALLSFDYRNKLLEQSSLLCKEMLDIDETTFFYHKKDMQSLDDFTSFFNSLWKDSITTYLSGFKSDAFNYIEEYEKNRSIENSIETSKINGTLTENLVKLNCFYNLVPSIQNVGKIQFGDILELLDENGTFIKYLLCITPHCDCFTPSKINNRFLFVEGQILKKFKSALTKLNDSDDESIDLAGILKNAESYHLSFIKPEAPQIVNWICKPYTVYICERQNNKAETSAIIFEDKTYNIRYLCTLKENYAQRIANHSLSHANRVGISFAKLKEDKAKKK